MLVLINKYLIHLDISSFFLIRIISSMFFSFFMMLSIIPHFIKILNKINIKQSIKSYTPESHKAKINTPTMGGVIILLTIFISILIWANLSDYNIVLIILTFLSYGTIGFIDDYYKVFRKNKSGLSISMKYIYQSFAALILIIVMFYLNLENSDYTNISLPFLKNELYLGIWYFLFIYFVIVGTSNAINLTDGLDGLVTFPIILISTGFLLSIIYEKSIDDNLASIKLISVYLYDELAIICAIITGSCLGFLWFNFYPAKIFMGDVGSLSLGGAIGMISILSKREFLLLILGGVIVFETVSVIIQVISFKLFNKRIFLMAPIHHHYELKGNIETHIIIRFWILSLLLFILGILIEF